MERELELEDKSEPERKQERKKTSAYVKYGSGQKRERKQARYLDAVGNIRFIY